MWKFIAYERCSIKKIGGNPKNNTKGLTWWVPSLYLLQYFVAWLFFKLYWLLLMTLFYDIGYFCDSWLYTHVISTCFSHFVWLNNPHFSWSFHPSPKRHIDLTLATRKALQISPQALLLHRKHWMFFASEEVSRLSSVGLSLYHYHSMKYWLVKNGISRSWIIRVPNT